MDRHTDFDIVPPEEKISCDILPYLTFPLTTRCPFSCVYCGEGGEGTASFESMPSLEFVKSRALDAYDYGIRKFRLTGGEPTLHPDFCEMVEFFSSLEDCFLLINTNGSLIERHEEAVARSGANVHFAVSLDSLTPANFDRISGTEGYFDAVINAVELLAQYDRLYRLNMVVNKWNIHEVFHLIGLCRKLECDLKLLAVVSVPIPHSIEKDVYIRTDRLEDTIANLATSVEFHEYARSFGTPCNIYTMKGVRITVKSQTHGSRYDVKGICSDCSYYPCHEGLYDMFLLPDGRLCGCRWSETGVSKGDSFVQALDGLVEAFQRAQWYQPATIQPMRPYPRFVAHVRECSTK